MKIRILRLGDSGKRKNNKSTVASLITTIIGLIIISQSTKTYAKRWEGAVKIGHRMANAIVEYVGGIQVVKAFSQSAGSYKKYSAAVEDNAAYYVD